MSDRLPPLTALRAFDAAARHMSFAKAADELNVTPAALSFQIKALEDHLGQAVFHRLNRAVALTDVGELLAPGVADGFTSLTAAWRVARNATDQSHLTVTAGPAFTAKWLAPRLYDFAQAHPDIELRFSASLKLVDLTRDGVDVALRFGTGPDDGMFSMPLAFEWSTPVMTPALAQNCTSLDDLAKMTLITDQSTNFLAQRIDWPAWFRTMGAPVPKLHGPAFSQADHAIDAALAGVGAALGRRALVIKDIADGRLVAPFKQAIDAQSRFRFICQKGQENRPAILAFRNWIMTEIAKTQHISDQFDVRPVAPQ
ncbi:MAG: transcriptional regulator GcvA [Pseudomonadota bacterium]